MLEPSSSGGIRRPLPRNGNDTDPATTQNFAASKFHKLIGNSATFTSDTQACGNHVTASMNYSLNYILGRRTVALSAAAFFPVRSATAT